MSFFVMSVLSQLGLASETAQAQACMLEGAGQIEISCKDETQNIEFETRGSAAYAMNALTVKTGIGRFATNPERELPATVFEQVHENLFTYHNEAEAGVISIMGLPRSFVMNTQPLQFPRGARLYTGSFLADLRIVFRSPSKLVSADSIKCTFKIVSCPRTLRTLPSAAR